MDGHMVQTRLTHPPDRIFIVEDISTDEEMRRALIIRLKESHQLICTRCWTVVEIHGNLAVGSSV
jgi:hypothetical protein